MIKKKGLKPKFLKSLGTVSQLKGVLSEAELYKTNTRALLSENSSICSERQFLKAVCLQESQTLRCGSAVRDIEENLA